MSLVTGAGVVVGGVEVTGLLLPPQAVRPANKRATHTAARDCLLAFVMSLLLCGVVIGPGATPRSRFTLRRHPKRLHEPCRPPSLRASFAKWRAANAWAATGQRSARKSG